MKDKIKEIADWIASAKRVVVMTGAGVSAESGIPTFRDALDGYWSKYNAEDLATPEAFRRDPELVSRWYEERRQAVLACEPNTGHIALVELEKELERRGSGFTLLTQNVDGLHWRAGSQDVVEVHGSLIAWRGVDSRQEFRDLPPFKEFPPKSRSGEVLRPAVVWFGEALPTRALDQSTSALSECDVYLAIGTSGVVHPAAGFVHIAKGAGARSAELNLNETPMTSYFDAWIHGRSGDVLPALVQAVKAHE